MQTNAWKNRWKNGSYEIKDKKTVTTYRTASSKNNNDFLLTESENIISRTGWRIWLI